MFCRARRRAGAPSVRMLPARSDSLRLASLLGYCLCPPHPLPAIVHHEQGDQPDALGCDTETLEELLCGPELGGHLAGAGDMPPQIGREVFAVLTLKSVKALHNLLVHVCSSLGSRGPEPPGAPVPVGSF